MPEPHVAFESRPIRPGITLYHHRSTKWKTDYVRFTFANDLDGGIAARSIATYVVRHGARGVEGQDAVSRFLQGLWGGGLAPFVTRTARHHLLVLRGTVVSRSYLPKRPDTFAKLIDFLSRLITEPWMAESAFPRELFELERKNLLRAIDAIADNKPQYAQKKLVETMFAGHPMALMAFGDRDDIAKVTFEEAVAAWQRSVSERPLLIHVVSPRSIDDVSKMLEKHLVLADRPGKLVLKYDMPPLAKRPRRVVEVQDIAQTRLAVGYRIKDYDRRRDAYPAHLGDQVFGDDASSRLFKNVREKSSLAYSIGSSFDDRTGTLVVAAGLDKKNVVPATAIVKREMRRMARGDIAPSDIQTALAAIDKSLETMLDSQEALVNFDLGLIFGARKERDIAAIAARYRKVKVAEIAEIFSRLVLDTTVMIAQSKAKSVDVGDESEDEG